MTCDAWVVVVTRRRKGSGKAYQTVKFVQGKWVSTFGNGQYGYAPAPQGRPADTERCGGSIRSAVRAVDEPYFGGTSATLEITHTCERCGNTFHPGVPNTYNIDDWLTQQVANMPELP